VRRREAAVTGYEFVRVRKRERRRNNCRSIHKNMLGLQTGASLGQGIREESRTAPQVLQRYGRR